MGIGFFDPHQKTMRKGRSQPSDFILLKEIGFLAISLSIV
jgi:hypothetical protein